MKQSIATTQANFADIRRQNSVYIDKTKQIYDCFFGVDKYYFLARPRRFGKSMLCNTLHEIFLGNKELFKGLWIEQSDWQWATHPVIYLDMTFAAGSDNTVKNIEEAIHELLDEHAQKYAVMLPPQTKSIHLRFKALVTNLYEKFGKGVVIIIDEYDKPILDLVDNPKMRNKIHTKLRSFYSPLKPLEAKLSKVFLTGVYKFTQTSIFSNLNNLQDLTFSPKAGTLVGYTEEEVKKYFNDDIENLAKKLNVTYEAMLDRLRTQYNGYRFGIELITETLSQGVYNSYAMNNVFASLDLIDKWFESGSPAFLIQKIREGKFVDLSSGSIQLDFNKLKNSCSPDDIDAVSLFYYAGYATMQTYDSDSEKIHLGYPNLEVSTATARELIKLFKIDQSSAINDLALNIAKSLRTHQFDALKDLFDQALAQLTYQIIDSTEHFFQAVVLLILQMGRLRAEAEVPTNNGSMDIVITLPNEIIIIELKFNKLAAEGLAQIKDKNYAKKFRAAGTKLMAVGLSITLDKADEKNNKCIADVAWEAL